MSGKKRNIVIAITGASGSVYARELLAKLEEIRPQIEKVAVVFTSNARDVWKHELGDYKAAEWVVEYGNNDFYAPFASGSSLYDTLIVCPCSMGMLGRIANGISNDLISRCADVMLKERRKLIVVPRETPYNRIHLKNMLTLDEAGGVICPATPSFYTNPENFSQLANSVTDRVLSVAGFSIETERWGD